MKTLRNGMMTLGILALLSVGIACDEDQAPDPRISATVLVVAAAGSAPVGAVEVLLWDVERGAPAASPLVTDAAGFATVDGLPVRAYLWILMPGQGWVSSRAPEEPDQAAAKSDSFHIIEVLPTAAGGARHVSGTVVDHATGEPLADVVIAVPGWPDGWFGIAPASSDLSDAAGVFSVDDIDFVAGPGGTDPFQFHPLIFQREGYAPTAQRFELPYPGATDIPGVVVRMRRLAAGETGAVTGRVSFRGEAAAGVDVNATWIGGEDKSWLSHPGLVTTTDSVGRFLLDGLAPGPWLLEPAFRSDDGWLLDRSAVMAAGVLPVEVQADTTVTLEDLALLRAVEPLYPLPGAVGVDSLATFTWSPVAEADSFDVVIGGWYFGRTDRTSLTVTEDFPLFPGVWSWSVYAVTAENELVGANESVQRFVVGPAQ